RSARCGGPPPSAGYRRGRRSASDFRARRQTVELVCTRLKEAGHRNARTDYRHDGGLRRRAAAEDRRPAARVLAWAEHLCSERELATLLEYGGDESRWLVGVPNRRVAGDAAALRAIRAGQSLDRVRRAAGRATREAAPDIST